jgi:hypothetical protein
VVIAACGGPHCPVELTRRLVNRAGLAGQQRPLLAEGRTPQTYGSQPMRYVVRRARLLHAYSRAGLDTSQLGTHSLRAGGATCAANAGVPFELWKEDGGWRSAAAAQGYVLTSDAQLARVTRSMHDSATLPVARLERVVAVDHPRPVRRSRPTATGAGPRRPPRPPPWCGRASGPW